MARRVTTQRKILFTVCGWLFGLIMFFPILWTAMTSFKSEGDAIASPPMLFYHWTLENYVEGQSRSN